MSSAWGKEGVLTGVADQYKGAGSLLKPLSESVSDLGEFVASGDYYRRAVTNTGILTERYQDSLANLALQGDKGYKQYLEVKNSVIEQIRAEVLRAYLASVKMYISIGYSEEEAEKAAKEVAKETKRAHMKMYDVLFPHSGKEVKHVY